MNDNNYTPDNNSTPDNGLNSGNGRQTGERQSSGQNTPGSGYSPAGSGYTPASRGIYSGYNSGYTRPNPQPVPPKQPKKKGGFGKALGKIVLACIIGVCFGCFAGLGLYAVNLASDGLGMIKDTVTEMTGLPAQEAEAAPAPAPADEVAAPSVQQPQREENQTAPAIAAGGVVATDVTQVVEKAMPSLVSIVNNFTQKGSNFFGQPIEQRGEASGSGIIVGENDTELLIATNNHVIDGAEELSITFIDGKTAVAQFKGKDSTMDLAVVSVPKSSLDDDTCKAIVVAELGNSDKLKVGEPAIAIGNALGYGQSVTTGVISALNRSSSDFSDGKERLFIQTDAAINPGNSGGALLNARGEVIGINSAKVGGTVIEGMGYAIPISAAQPIIDNLMSKETKFKVEPGQEAFIGIAGVNVTPDVSKMYDMPEGVYVAQVYEDTAAEACGIRKGDVITRFDGGGIATMEELQQTLQYYIAGTDVTITIQRNDGSGYKEMELSMTLGAKTETKS